MIIIINFSEDGKIDSYKKELADVIIVAYCSGILHDSVMMIPTHPSCSLLYTHSSTTYWSLLPCLIPSTLNSMSEPTKLVLSVVAL